MFGWMIFSGWFVIGSGWLLELVNCVNWIGVGKLFVLVMFRC